MTNQYMQEEDDAILKTYNRYPVVLDHGDGAYLYDPEGKKYLDFSAGYAVSSLGYNNKEFNDALKAQIDKMIHTSNLYYNTTCGKAGEDLKKITGMYKVFFTNSGGEAIEGAIKTARKYAYTKKTGRYEFIAMENSFHGRSMGAVALTGHKEYREPFEPVMPGVHFAIYNDLDSVKALVNDKTCAIILETIQGEGGINAATKEFMQGIRKICDENGILMICDEVQCGMGRSGAWFAWQQMGITPDIMTMAKAIGSGVPVGAFAMTKEVVNEIAPYLTQKLQEIVDTCDAAVKVKGRGLIQGLQITKPLGEVTAKALEEGLLIIGAGTDVIRMIPPLVIGKEQVDEMAEILKKALA